MTSTNIPALPVTYVHIRNANTCPPSRVTQVAEDGGRCRGNEREWKGEAESLHAQLARDTSKVEADSPGNDVDDERKEPIKEDVPFSFFFISVRFCIVAVAVVVIVIWRIFGVWPIPSSVRWRQSRLVVFGVNIDIFMVVIIFIIFIINICILVVFKFSGRFITIWAFAGANCSFIVNSVLKFCIVSHVHVFVIAVDICSPPIYVVVVVVVVVVVIAVVIFVLSPTPHLRPFIRHFTPSPAGRGSSRLEHRPGRR